MGKKLLLVYICVFFIAPSVALAGWKGDGRYRGQVEMVETRFPSQGGRVVIVTRTILNREGQVVETQDSTEFEGVPRGNKSVFVITHTQQGETRWTVSQAKGATSPSGVLFSRPLGSRGRVEVGVSYREDGVFSQLHLQHFDSCDEVTQDISYFAYSPFVLQEDIKNTYVTDCQLAETDTIFRDRNRAVTRYDGEGRPIETARYELSGPLIERETSQYNSHDDEIATTIVASDGTVKTKHVFELEYDAMGNWIKRTSKALVENGESVEGQVGLVFRSFEYFQPVSSPAQEK